MYPYCPATKNITLEQVETPSLLLDMDAFEQNLETMENALAGSGVGLRAHAKAHKCSEIARRQIAAGAVGICCQKVSEAIVMAEGGVSDILITNQIVDPVKLQRLCSIGASVNLSFLCDSSEVISTLSAVAVSEEVTLNIPVSYTHLTLPTKRIV